MAVRRALAEAEADEVVDLPPGQTAMLMVASLFKGKSTTTPGDLGRWFAVWFFFVDSILF